MDGSIALASHQVSPSLVVRPETQPEVSKPQAQSPTPAVRAADNGSETGPGSTLQAVELANSVADFFDRKISFSYDERIDRVIVTVLKESTEEVVRQIPPEAIIELIAKLREDFRGLIVNHTG